MIKKILNIGLIDLNSDSLNRKIRVSNLISFITIITMIGYIPAAIIFQMTGIIVLNILFLISSFLGFYLHSKHQYNAAIYITCGFGLIYFIFGTVFYGLQSNLHFFMLIMCLLGIALFESTLALRIFISAAVFAFFAMLVGLKGKDGILTFTDEMRKAQDVISVVNLFILFIVTILFFTFFRRENLLFQKAILKQKDIIEEKQKEILDSIAYAKRIQFSLLASENLLKNNLPEYFVLFKPKDVVSGDFYWATPTPDGFIYITADCTGHGVPGAFMSLLNISKLNQVINENKITRPDLILNNVRAEIIQVLNAEGSEESKDGMDAVLCKLDLVNMKLQYAAANNSFYIIRDKQLLTCKADKMPVGKGHDDSISFTFNEVELKKGDAVYTFTDGYADQFGGQKGKKFRYKQLEDILVSICHLPAKEQLAVLEQKFEDWKGDLDQVDDVLVMGIKV
ncbi:MAG: SpoIIE family protein phosphatase [Bacteroidota bacterium]